MVVENGGNRIVLQHVSGVRTAGVGAGTRNQITAVWKLELKKIDRDGIQVKRRVRYRTGRTLNLYAAVGCRVVEVSRPIARGLRTECCSQRGDELLSRAVTLRERRPTCGAFTAVAHRNRRSRCASSAISGE